MIDYSRFLHAIAHGPLAPWAEVLPAQLAEILTTRRHGKLPQWLEVLEQLPELDIERIDLDCDTVSARSRRALDEAERQRLRQVLLELHPWRKGPFDIAGIKIDTEWRSDWKWQRLAPHISPLQDRLVLDVGAGSGYHLWRMLGAGARRVIGIDPTMLFVVQFHAIKKYLGTDLAADLLPLGIEDLPPGLAAFDTVFSMGVLYHRRSPLDHLLELRDALRPGGELVLETLVVKGDEHTMMLTPGRYAKMRNVWFIPSPAALEIWLERCGFEDVHTVDVADTRLEEQRATPWMQFESLADFLDPTDRHRTIEGHPAPRRAVVVARKGA